MGPVVTVILIILIQTINFNTLVDIIVPIYTLIIVTMIAIAFRAQKQAKLQAAMSLTPQIPTETKQEEVEEKEEDTNIDEFKDKPNFTGEWTLVNSTNYDEFLAVQNVNYLLRKAAAGMSLKHVIDHKGKRFKLSIFGPVTQNMSYIIGGPPTETQVKGKKFLDTVSWNEQNELVIHKLNKAENYELIIRRELQSDQKTIIMRQTARLLDGSKSVEATQTFSREK